MEQINIRVEIDEKRVIDILAKLRGTSVSEIVKQAILKEIASIRVDLAFDLLKQGKIGRKQTWKLSGLSAHEFLVEWSRRGAEESAPDDLVDKEIDIANHVDLKKYMRES